LQCSLRAFDKLKNRMDALIVSDPGVILMCQEMIPDMPLHLSTQTGTFNTAAMRFWKQQGIERVVLPREMNIEEISAVTRSGIIETEIFVHGAMCVSVSGRCLLGAYMNGRHPNRGDCSQPCRIKYRITPVENDTGSSMSGFDAEETEQGVYLLNSKDLCSVEVLPEIVCSGVSSLKIEGRNKSIHYVASVAKVYREALDEYCKNPDEYTVKPSWNDILNSVEHRPYTTGFLKGEYALQEVFTSKATSPTRVIAIVKAVLKDGVPILDVKNSFSCKDELEVLPVARNASPQMITVDTITDMEGNALSYAPSNRLVLCHSTYRLRVGDMLRKKIDK
ncbi:MAG TPA: U32 family peptidase C-terminal domain-containing protein, partial [Chitinispirillaceae bacterium]|nr:U32 family peptidase C-terminal domain-containing protein [Chitinispirillaceae bacterium]